MAFLVQTQYFYAQQVNQDQAAQDIELNNYENELKKSSNANYKKLDNKISDLKKQQRELEKKKKHLSKSQNDLKSTTDKINKLEAANQKIENKITTSSKITDEEIQKQKIKTTKNSLNIQKLKLLQITQQKELEKAMSTL
jgi:uncharacterized protein (DUF3084 family)